MDSKFSFDVNKAVGEIKAWLDTPEGEAEFKKSSKRDTTSSDIMKKGRYIDPETLMTVAK